MFGSLIRRKQTRRPLGEDNIAFESTTFSLTTAVPRPTERRSDERMIAMLRVAKLTDVQGREQLIRVRNVSAGGLMAEIGHPVSVGDIVEVELSSQKISSSVIWTRDGTAGFKFEQNIDLGELLAGRKPRHGFRPRPPRLEVNCKANVKVENNYYTVEVHDISLGGMKVEPIEEYCLGKPVVVVIESLRPVRGEVRWFSDRKAGIVFDQPLKFEELAEWIGKRLEMATLKAGAKN
ncbi:MAG: PilZ domain-containing protein [Sphingomonas sp.]|nr:PilZ domain-containing protein [Sphingomonas sp.]